MKQAVLFDLDGTLLNSLPDIAQCMNAVLADNGLPAYPQADYRYMTGNGASLLAQRAVGKRQDLYEKALREYAALYAKHCYDSSFLYPGAADMVYSLRKAGLRLALLSNKDDADTAAVVAHYFPDAPFEIVRGHLPGVPLKPDPAAAKRIADEMGLSPADFWHLGDTPTDLRCAKASGMAYIAVTWGFRSREELLDAGAEILVDSAEEALRVITGNPL